MVAPTEPNRPASGRVSEAAEDGTTRSRLLDAAAEVFCERGYDGTTVSEVARRAGLTTGAIYANFRDKAELLLQTIERGAEAAIGDMEAARSAGVSAANRFLLMARRMVTEQDRTDQLLLVEMFNAARRDPDVGRRVAETLAAMERELGRLIDRAKADGDVDAAWDTATVARFCMAVGVGYTQLDTAGLDRPDLAAWTGLVKRLLESIRP